MASDTQDEIALETIATLSPKDIEMGALPIKKELIKIDDPFLVIFTLPFDAENPKDWPLSRKWAVTDVLSATGFNRIMVSIIMAPALPIIAKELDMNSAESVMALSIYLLATAFGPLVMGPLSEIYGREKVLHASSIWFLIWNIACGFANTKGLLIAARFMAGFGASAIYALGGGVLGDVWRPAQRGRSLGMYLLIPLLGAAVGPIIGGFMADRTTWRWMFWSTSIFQAVMILVSFTTFRETYGPQILKRRAECLRRETGNQQYHTAFDSLNSQKSVLTVLARTLTPPLRLLAFHPIIQIDAIISAFEYGVLYILLTSFSSLWTSWYHESAEMSGLHYLAIAFGEMAGSQFAGPVMDFLYARKQSQSISRPAPEFRLLLTFLGSLVGPIGFFIYGWTAQYRVHWIAVDIGMFIATFGSQIAGMALTAYVIDVYSVHTSSAMAASQFLRSLTAFLFPLFAPSMFDRLGYGWGNSFLGFLILGLGLPGPWILWKYGKRLREKAISTE